MNVGSTKEKNPEKRISITPDTSKNLKDLGLKVFLEKGYGESLGFRDEDYKSKGVEFLNNSNEICSKSDLICKVNLPAQEEINLLKQNTNLIVSNYNPDKEKNLIKKDLNVFALNLLPRITRAQSMDVLSSQANLAGYVTVIQAAFHCPKIFPMMMTPAGTFAPGRVFIIGAGGAGLQAIATAKRLGARVEAFDTRPVVAEQVQSLGAKFLDIDLGEVGQTEQGYAKELTAEQLEKQREGQKRVIGQSDVLITTAQVFGRPAPRIVGLDMVEAMNPGSVVVDMAVESGGNVEGSKLDEVVDVGGVKIIGQGILPSEVARNASEMYSNNLFNLVSEFWDEEQKTLVLDPEDEIIKSCLITQGGDVINETIKNLYNGG